MKHVKDYKEFLYEVFYTECPFAGYDSEHDDFQDWFDRKDLEDQFALGDQFHRLQLKLVVNKVIDKLTQL